MSTLILFIESYTAGGADYVARLLMGHLPVNQMIVFVNRAADMKILQKDKAGGHVRFHKYLLPTPADLDIYANRFVHHKLIYIVLKAAEIVLRYPLMFVAYVYFYWKVKKIRPTHFLAHNGGYPGGRYCISSTLAASSIKGVKCFHAYHSMPVRRAHWTSWVESYIDALLDRRCKMISVSEAGRTAIRRLRGFRQMPICIYNGLPDHQRKVYQKPRKIKLLHVGYFDTNKNQIMLLRMLLRLIDKAYLDIELTFVGSVSENIAYKRVRAFVAEHKMEDFVKFEGFSQDVESFYRNNDVLLLSSKVEGFPMVILEAMRVGMPVVATRVGGVEEQIVDGVSGFIVDPEDDEGMAEKIVDLINTPELIQELGRGGRRIFEETYTIQHMIEGYVKALKL